MRFPEVGISVLAMGTSKQAVSNIRTMINNDNRSFAWLSRETGIPYKRILAEIKNETRPISLETAIASSKALNVGLPAVLAGAA